MINESTNRKKKSIQKILEVLHEDSIRSTQLHQKFLEHQKYSLKAFAQKGVTETPTEKSREFKQVIFNKKQLQEFGSGSIEKCFGPEYKLLDHRRSPRIPNGDLLTIDRVIEISGELGKLKEPASITTEFDISKNNWFIKENFYPGIPYGILMEIALQPCGILSAYMGTSLILSPESNLFRNLDGEIFFSKIPLLTNSIIQNHSTLLTSIDGGGMHIQKYSFELSSEGMVFLRGNSSFGYFTQAVMEKQTGIDSSRNDFSLLKGGKGVDIKEVHQAENNCTNQHLDLIDRISFFKQEGKYENGYVVGGKKLCGSEWFFNNHFYQDPVMPGSLGMETIIHGLWIYAKSTKSQEYFHKPIIDFSGNKPFSWKYRGQILPTNKYLNFEIHIKEDQTADSYIYLLADADFWVDGVKIYAFRDISMRIHKGK